MEKKYLNDRATTNDRHYIVLKFYQESEYIIYFVIFLFKFYGDMPQL